jgi:3-oxoacyl-[acyl-carrier protein] reductase
MQFKGRVAIITGAGQGIGRSYAKAFSEGGASVVVADINAERAASVAKEITDAGGKAIAVAVDVSDKAAVDRMAADTLKAFSTIDILINNAAVFSTLTMKPFDEIPVDEWDKVQAVNSRGVFLCCQAVARTMKAKRYGKIVNISSSVVVTGRANYAHYVASKGAVVALTRALATELGVYEVNVNAISPHGIVTEIPRATITEDQWASILAAQAIKRKGDAADMIGPTLFLASDASRYMTGQTLNVDAGLRFN